MARPDIHGSTRVACGWSQVTERDPSDPLAAGVEPLHGFSKFGKPKNSRWFTKLG